MTIYHTKAVIDSTGHKVELIHRGRWVEVELPYSIYRLADLALRQMEPKERGDGKSGESI